MNVLIEILKNEVLWTAILCWFVAQFLKFIFTLIKYKKIDITRFVGSGGMPSSHSSFVTGLANSIGIKSGYGSNLFAFSLVFALVVMYDAAGVRQSVGKQAAVLNRIFEQQQNQKFLKVEFSELKELVGHTPMEVICGALLGIVMSSMVL